MKKIACLGIFTVLLSGSAFAGYDNEQFRAEIAEGLDLVGARENVDVADVALLLPEAASLRTEVLAVLGGGAMQIDTREFLVVGKGEGIGEIRYIQTVADRNSLGLVRKWDVGSKIARGRINTAASRIACAIAGVADRKNVSIEIGC